MDSCLANSSAHRVQRGREDAFAVFPVIIPQGTDYPATTYEIANVSNFMSKGSSLASCDVSVNISCFAEGYGTTYNQAKAVVEALDLYQVTYSEDGQSYTAKFRFMNLDDEYSPWFPKQLLSTS